MRCCEQLDDQPELATVLCDANHSVQFRGLSILFIPVVERFVNERWRARKGRTHYVELFEQLAKRNSATGTTGTSSAAQGATKAKLLPKLKNY